MITRRAGLTRMELSVVIAIVAVALVVVLGGSRLYENYFVRRGALLATPQATGSAGAIERQYLRRAPVDTSGLFVLGALMPKWRPESSLEEIGNIWRNAGRREIEKIDRRLAGGHETETSRLELMIQKSLMLNYEGEAEKSYQALTELRKIIELNDKLATRSLGSLIYFQGITGLRRGENDNCVMCRGESSCILPISPSAVHTNPAGSRTAIKHFTEYLDMFPGELDARWLLNLAHMTLGEYPDKVDPRFRLDLSSFFHSEFNIGKFRDVGHLVGVNRFNQAGGAIMEDFDNDGLLDIAVTSWDATQPMSFYRNKGDATFEDRSEKAGVTKQLGGLVCYQTDYDNDGRMDIYIARGAWVGTPVRPTLLRNDGANGFTDVTKESGLLDPVNSNAAGWADYDNDGWLDLFVACERQTSRLYHNKRDGTFEQVAAQAGVRGEAADYCKGCAWIDYDNDGYPDLFINHLARAGRLYHNNRDGTFTDFTLPLGIDGPLVGFSCWAWDYDNDGWLDIFATCYDRTLTDIVKGIMGQPHRRFSNRLFRNQQGRGFKNVTKEAGLNLVFSTMGSNFGDFDNDRWLDMYLGTGEPDLGTLVPNRMFKNVGGQRFAEITGSSGTGHLQKGHGVACGDWDRDGDVDIFAETGGAVNGDKYHNVLFQNPGQGNHWLTLKLVGKKTNRAAIGARIKVVTAGEQPLTVYRHVSSGSSFGANPLQQTVGLAEAKRVAVLEVQWPTSGTTQVFRDIAADQAIEVTEFAESYRPLEWKPLPPPG
jgi:FG-GAP-like repeat/ASPIC and UnbV